MRRLVVVLEDDPVALLFAQDPEAALAVYEQRLNRAPSPLDACRGRADVLNAMIVRAPWMDDARVVGALDDLVASAQALSQETAEECLDGAEDTIDRMMSIPIRGLGWREPLELYEHLRPVAASLTLHEFVERGYVENLALSDVAGALTYLSGVAGRLDATWAAELAASLREDPDLLAHRCGQSPL